MPSYQLRPDGAFVIRDYQAAPAFASFFSGIAGPWGRPLWAFYVNRGQAVASFGLRDKDHAILEFHSATKAYRLTPTHGFRTFIKQRQGRRTVPYEPFHSHASRAEQRLTVTAAELTLEETHRAYGLRVEVRYFTVPNEPFAALARVLTLTNLSRSRQRLDVLDGLPAIVPYGCSEWFLKHMSRTIEAWVTVANLERRAPVFRLAGEPHDRPEVVPITGGNFYAAWVQQGASFRSLPVVVESARIFGETNELATPHAFWSAQTFRVPARQLAANQTPAAMSFARIELTPHGSAQLVSLIGHTRDDRSLNAYLKRVDSAFVDRKAAENYQIVQQLQDQLLTVTAEPRFDRYAQQTFLDNGLRGGFPVSVGPQDQGVVLYLYGRKHGDLERDYNQFTLEPTPYSQGNANYRDANQNRRSDGWICPEAAIQNLLTFASLLQLDGFNPLVYTGVRFRVPRPDPRRGGREPSLQGDFTPGEISQRLAEQRIAPGPEHERKLAEIIAGAERIETAEHGEGFWTDHWFYNLDLLENVAALFPERLQALLQERCPWFDNAHVVVPREQKHVMADGAVRQLRAVRKDAEKAALLQGRATDAHWARTRHGHGEIYRSSLLAKLVIVVLNRLASLDPDGIGLEMEADKPDWFDSLNGLPALFGSSVSETCELIRWLHWLQDAVGPDTKAALPVEAAEFLERLRHALQVYLEAAPSNRDFQYWDQATTAKEQYRAAIRLGVSGAERSVSAGELKGFFALALERLKDSLPRAFDRQAKVYRTYFWYEPVRHEPLGEGRVRVTAFKRHALPLFLEGNVHALRLMPDRARTLHRSVTRSRLYDRKLGMYKVTEPLAEAPLEIGRCRVFTPGWLEHESVWLHMEYKYLLELLRAGLAEEFFACFQRAGIPFQPPRRYGRSPLENSSFLVSSAYADPALHGRGFVARLTGSTAEFLEMWRLMMVGSRPFALEEGRLSFNPQPILPGWLFTKHATNVTFTRRSGRTETIMLPKETISFLLFGETLVTYHNPKRKSSFGKGAVRPRAMRLLADGQWLEWADGKVPAPYAERLRVGEIPHLDVLLA